ncbi:MAG TPA: hypothetical protein VGY53_11545, partial [Isosphaeraceae bacterium]|nr:hypothetical protein [Isosphaeraceae bacterium]
MLGVPVLALMTILMGAALPKGPKPMREVVAEGYRIRLDLSGQVLKADIPDDRGFGGEGSAEAPISATLADIPSGGLVSASMLAQKAKQFDDGLYAAVELAAQQGAGGFPGKSSLLKVLAEHFKTLPAAPRGNALDLLFAACQIGNVPATVPAPLTASSKKTIDAFLGNELRSKPISFYTWSPELSAIFQQDRLLQTELEGRESTSALLKAFGSEPNAKTTYDQYLTLVSRLTNPLAYPSLREVQRALEARKAPVPDKGVYFFPPSLAHETELVKQLYGNRPIPAGFSLVDEMIKRIKSGQIALKPTEKSGWYDYQTWALEPLVIPERMPESGHLQAGEGYRKQLLELFKGILALTRETHIKQLEVPMAGAMAPMRPRRPEVTIRPDLTAEPLATFYRRRADAYRFVRGVLTDTFGAEALKQMHRLTARGPVKPELATELDEIERIFRGAAATVEREIGMPAAAATNSDQ